MIDSSAYVELVKAIPVVVGGLLALGGGLIGQIVTHRLAVKRDRSKLRRERLESFVKALYAHDQWLDDKRNAMIFANIDHDIASPLDEARMIQALHFPELSDALLAILEAQQPLIVFIGQQRSARNRNQADWLKAFDNEEYSTLYRSYRHASDAATSQCRELLLAQPES